jgi:hypothetical protein
VYGTSQPAFGALLQKAIYFINNLYMIANENMQNLREDDIIED